MKRALKDIIGKSKEELTPEEFNRLERLEKKWNRYKSDLEDMDAYGERYEQMYDQWRIDAFKPRH